MDVTPGQRFSRYRIVSELGSGGMGKVYLAEDESLGRKVALKFLLSDEAPEESTLRRFLQEARSAAAIDHPYACKIYETGEAEGRPFIAMEYVEGESLAERLKSGPLSAGEGLRLAREIAEGHAKVMDFGLAKRESPLGGQGDSALETATVLTMPGTVLGTLAYMAPEQIRGSTGDRRSDVFAFGILLYEMLSGVHPFRRATPGDTLAAILGADPAPIEGLPDTLTALLRDLLAKEPDQRPQDLSSSARCWGSPSSWLSVGRSGWAIVRPTRGTSTR